MACTFLSSFRLPSKLDLLFAYHNDNRDNLLRENIRPDRIHVVGNTIVEVCNPFIEKFKNIKGDLELELVQLYLAQDNIDGAIVRLESIIKDYERTKTSAEAYYLLGQINLSYLWKPDLAKEKFIHVKKEFNRFKLRVYS